MIDPGTVKSMADAAKATAETAGKALEQTAGYMKALESPFRHFVGFYDDKLQFRRWKNQILLLEQAGAILREKGMQKLTREIPLKFGVRLLESASLEEDDELRNKWARLLVNAGDSSTAMDIHIAYVEVLSGMSAFDVKNLATMAKVSLEAPKMEYLPVVETGNLPFSAKLQDEQSNESAAVSEEVGVSLANLARLGCVSPASGWGGIAIFKLMTVTYLGRSLYRACA
jgi:Abortive infection alpha